MIGSVSDDVTRRDFDPYKKRSGYSETTVFEKALRPAGGEHAL